MALSASDYVEAALLRRDDAWALYDQRQWVGAIYLAGRAVECLLRALTAKRGLTLEIGHDLRSQFARTRHIFEMGEATSAAVEKSVNELAIVWRNDLRYTGVDRMLRLLREAGRTRKIGTMRVQGDPMKANAKSVLEAYETVISRGEPIWRRYSKN